MLKVIRTETEQVKHKRGDYKRTIYIVLCSNCNKEMRKQKSGLIRHTGKCVKCVKRVKPPYWQVYQRLLFTAKREGHKISLTYDEFELFTQIGCCAYCPKQITWNKYKAGPYNLDRKDNSKGYHKDNAVVCCKECNLMKNKFAGFEEFKIVRRALDIANKSNEDREELWAVLLSWSDRFDPHVADLRRA